MSYAQFQDESIIDGFFGKDYVGRFLDIGAFDGVSMSNTRALALRGWSGVLVEPSPWVFPRLYAIYKDHKDKFVVINAAVARESGFMSFWVNAVAIQDLLDFFDGFKEIAQTSTNIYVAR